MTDQESRLVNTPAENLIAGKRLADEIVRGDRPPASGEPVTPEGIAARVGSAASGEPSTAAGRAFLRDLGELGVNTYAFGKRVCRIEAEAHTHGKVEGIHIGVEAALARLSASGESLGQTEASRSWAYAEDVPEECDCIPGQPHRQESKP
jgi:hypothetical protein